MGFLKRLDPREGAVDFWQEFRRPNPHRWPVLAVSMMMTGSLLYVFAQERAYIPPAEPDVDYIVSFAEGRTDAEIIASNIANQKLKDERAARRVAIEERKRELFRTLGEVSGMDVDEIERKAAEDRATEEAANAAEAERQANMTGEPVAPLQR